MCEERDEFGPFVFHVFNLFFFKCERRLKEKQKKITNIILDANPRDL